MPQRLIKLNDVGKHNCQGIYFVDERELFEGYDKIEGKLVPTKFNYDYKLVLRRKKGNKLYKKTFSFSRHITLNKAVDEVLQNQALVFEEKKRSKKVPTLNEYWKEYVEHKLSTVNRKESWRESTKNDMLAFYKKWIEPSSLGKKLVTDIEENDVEKIIKKIQQTKSLRTSKKVVEALAPLLKRYYKLNNIQRLNPAQIEIGALNNEREVVLSIKEIKRLYDAMYSYPIERFKNVFIWLSTGRRVNEVLSLRYEDLNFEKGMYNIHQDNSKSGRKLTFVIREDMTKAIKKVNNLEELVHISEKGKKLISSTLQKHWKSVLEEAKLKDIHMHDIRHLIGSTLRDSGVSEDLRALVLGHSKTSITARYASQNAELTNELFEFFLAKINGSKVKWSELED